MMVLPSINVLVTDNMKPDEQLSNFLLEPPCLKIRFAGPDANVNDDLQNIEQLVGHELHPLVLDFYKIALSVYIADLQKKKKSKTYCRTISILIAVSDTGKWNSLKQKLEGTLRFLSGDNFKFYFVKSEKQTAPFKFEERDKRVVSLFSGGLDSLAGAKWLFDQKLEPVLVAHGGRNTMFKVQSALVDKLEQIVGKKLLFGQISARARLGKKLYSKEYSEPCRSFLYLTLGLVFALELGIKKLFVFENGTLALNVPISQSRIYLNTRTTHPVFMEDYKNLVSSIFGAPISIENPFLHMTKGEVVSILNYGAFKDLVKDTRTCSTESYRYKGIKTSECPNCGVCLPCMLRRIAVHFAGLWNNDATYAFDVLAQAKDISEETQTLVFEMLDFGHRLEQCKTDYEATNEFPQFLVENFDPSPLISMYKRQFQQTKDFLRQRAHPSFQQILPWL